jgi:hypothetical protein
VTDEFREIRELRDQFMRAVYDLRDPHTGYASGEEVMQRMGLDPDNTGDENRYLDIAKHFDQLGYVRREMSGYGMVSITVTGSRYVEGDL